MNKNEAFSRVIVDKDYAEGPMTDAVRDFKRRLASGAIVAERRDPTRDRLNSPTCAAF